MLAGLNAYGNTKITEEEKSRDHTENFLRSNYESIKIQNKNKKLICIEGKRNLKAIDVTVPGDPSSAAFIAALTLLKKNSYVKIKNVGLNPTRIGFYNLLKINGAKIKFQNKRKINNEFQGDIIVRSSNLKPILASKKYYVNSTDEYPILFVMASLIEGTS